MEYFSNNNTKLPDTTYTHTQFILWNVAIKQPRNLASDPSRLTAVGFGERTLKIISQKCIYFIIACGTATQKKTGIISSKKQIFMFSRIIPSKVSQELEEN